MSEYHTKAAYEARLRHRRAARTAPHPFRVFCHVSCMPGWEPVGRDLFRYLASVGLDEVYGCVIGQADVAAMAGSYGVRFYELDRTQDFSRCEGPTLNRVYEYAVQNPRGAVLYLHTKGASAPADPVKANWRRLMLTHLVGSWRGHLEALSEYDAVGCAWQPDRDFPHYSGNFWLARCDWLARLQPPWEYRLARPPTFRYAGHSWRERMYAEHWLGSQPWHHIMSLLGTGTSIWEPGWQRLRLGSVAGFDWDGTSSDSDPPMSRPAEALAVFDHRTVAVGAPGHVYNGASILWQGGRVLAVRVGGQITRSSIFLARLEADYRPTGDCRKLDLVHPDCAHSQEDPRLFWHAGRPHLSFTGTRMDNGQLISNVLHAPLDDRLEPTAVYHPQVPGRTFWEKNHAYFDFNGRLMAVYSTRPHRILEIDGERAEFIAETAGPPQWAGGDMRGGASPVLHDGHWYHWFHGRSERPGKNVHYQIGCLKFEDRPPFKVVACTHEPVLSATAADDNSYGADVVFTCGATLEGDDWHVAVGVADRRVEIRKWTAAEIEARMRPV